MAKKIKARLFVEVPLAAGTALWLGESQAHQLIHTLRSREGDAVSVFNGTDGEWLAHATLIKKKQVQLSVESMRAPQKNAPDIWLVFAPVKNEKIDFMVKRAVELGVSALLPVITRHTIVSRVNMERLYANAIEAAEQCGRMDVPALHEPQTLDRVLGAWSASRMLIHADESGRGLPIHRALATQVRGPAAVLIGPEGGFAGEERRMIALLSATIPVSLGPRILRAETAALAALAHAQAWLGDGDELPCHAAFIAASLPIEGDPATRAG